MIIRRKMPRLSSRRPIGVTGLRSLQQSSAHVRRMVVSQLPASFSNASTATARSDQASDYPSFDAPLAPPNSEPKSRMPKDLQAIFDMHKALGHVQTPTKSLIERIAEQKASEPPSPPPPSARIQKRPDNVRYEPESRIQRSSTPTFTDPDIEPLPEMLPPKSNRVRSFVEYVNVSSGIPDSRQSDETGDSDSNETESEDDLPDAMPGSFTVDAATESSANVPIQRYVDDEHPTLVDMPLETFQPQLSSESNSETIQRSFDPIEASNEDLLPPSHRGMSQTDGENDSTDNSPIQRSFASSEIRDEDLAASAANYDETPMDSKGGTADSFPIQRSFDPIESSEEDLSPPQRFDERQAEFSDDFGADRMIDGGETASTPPLQRSFAPLETSEEDLSPPPRFDERQAEFSDDSGEGYADTVIDGGGETASTPPVQRSFAPLETSEEDLSPPPRFDERQAEFSDDSGEGYADTVIDGGGETASTPPLQRSFAPLETSEEDLSPPTHYEINSHEGDRSNVVVGNKPDNRNNSTRKSPPIQRNFDQIEASAEDLLPPASYSSDTQSTTPASPIQRSIDDEWEETPHLADADVPSFAKSITSPHEFDTLEISGEDLLPPSYQQSDRSKQGTVNTETSPIADHSQPRRMAVSRSDSPIVQRIPLSDHEQINHDVDILGGNYDLGNSDEMAASGLSYQPLDLGQALVDAGIAKSRPEIETPPQQPNSFPVLMPPIGRAHHSPAASSAVQRTPVQSSIQRVETPAPSHPSPSSVDASLLDALGMPPDTDIQRSGPQLPTISESPPVETEAPIAIQRVDSGNAEGGNDSEVLQNESASLPDVEEMAKQVYRILQRRFRIERERSKGR